MFILYKSFIRSKIDYGSILYGSASKTHLQKIKSIQKKYLRFIVGALHSTPVTSYVRWNRHSPFRNYPTDRFLTKTLSDNFASLIASIKFIISHWRFISVKLTLLCNKTHLIEITEIHLSIAPISFRNFSILLLISHIFLSQTLEI